MRECFAVENGKAASTRGGLSASEFCAADAVVGCSAAGVPSVNAGSTPSGTTFPPPPRLAPPAAGKPPSPKAAEQSKKQAEALTQIVLGGGKLKVLAGNPNDLPSYIRYNDNLIREFDGVYLGIHALISLNSETETVLIFYTNAGGSGTSNDYGIVSVGPNGRIYEENLPVGTGRFTYEVDGDRVSFDLGLTDGKEVRAIYANGRLDVTRKAAPKADLKSQDCNFLYNDVLSECATTQQSVCEYDDIGISMARQRPVNMMAADDPNFRHNEFEAVCEQACRAKKKPTFAAFRKAVCIAR